MELNVKICEFPDCKKEYWPNKPWQKYCSVLCQSLMYVKYPKPSQTVLVRLKPIVKCPHCEKEIDVQQLKEKK